MNNQPLSSLDVLPAASKTDDNDDETSFDFTQLVLVEKPDSALNSNDLPQTLQDCVGYLEELPLKKPNVDQRNPQTVADMINILTNPDATKAFERAMAAEEEEATTTVLTMTTTTEEGVDYNTNEEGGGERQSATSVTGGTTTTGNNNPDILFNYNYSSEIMIEQLASSNKNTSHIETCFLIGWVVKPGCISLYEKDGKTFAVSEGRYILAPFRGNWIWGCFNINLNQDYIQPKDSQVLIVRVLRGEVGLVVEQGTARLLDVGSHVYNSGTVKLIRKQKYAESNYFNHGPYNYLRVPRGKYAKVWTNVVDKVNGVTSLVPRLLKEGQHYIESVLFKFDGFVDASDQYIQHGSVHMISVPKGYLGKILHDQKPRLLGEGCHIIESTQCEYQGLVHIISTPCIVHGTITILRVQRGEVALAWNKNEPVFFNQPGLYEFDSPDFKFVEFKQAGERLISLGSKKIIQVYTGEVGVTYEQGQLCILKDGRHVIDSSTHIFECFLSTKQRSIRLMTLSDKDRKKHKEEVSHTAKARSSKKDGRLKADEWDTESADFIICDTKDLVKIGVRADVFYSIQDPEKCIQNIDPAELEDLVRETAVATLTNIIRSTALNQIAQSEHVSAHGHTGHAAAGGGGGGGGGGTTAFPAGAAGGMMNPTSMIKAADSGTGGNFGSATTTTTPVQQALPLPPSPTAPMFFEKAHDEFMNKLHDDFMERYGVSIVNIRIESFKIMDNELSYQISKQALTTAQVENELANLDGQSLILTQKERTAAEVKNINAEAEAKAKKTVNDAENLRLLEAAQAEAESLKIARKAEAEAAASAILTKAEAEARAAESKAESLKIACKAEADAILMKAEAEAKATRLKAAAESERAHVISQTQFGQQECLLATYAEMVRESNQGVNKVVYLDPSVNRQSPFALGSLDNLNRDLHSLSQMGIVSAGGGNMMMEQQQQSQIFDEKKEVDDCDTPLPRTLPSEEQS